MPDTVTVGCPDQSALERNRAAWRRSGLSRLTTGERLMKGRLESAPVVVEQARAYTIRPVELG